MEHSLDLICPVLELPSRSEAVHNLKEIYTVGVSLNCD
jgi:hypothetical protein